MRTFLILLLVAGLGGLFYYQKHHTSEPGADTTQSSKPIAQVQQHSPATPAQPSEHNWMKRSLDRATEVRDQARAQTRQAQDP